MKTTKNLGLTLHGMSDEDVAQYFKDWRQKINGEDEGSNMQIIDKAFGDLKSQVDATMNRAVDGRELTDFTWTQLIAKAKSGDSSGIHVGDWKSIQLTGPNETVKMQIAGINVYKDTCDTAVGNHIDWISIDCLNDLHNYNTEAKNNGTETENCPYCASELYKYLQETVYPRIPAEVQAGIANKRMLMGTRYSANGSLNDDTGWAWKDMGKVWLPTEYEVFGSQVWSTRSWGAGQAMQYPIFANSNIARIKGKGNGGGRYGWWLASPRGGSSTNFCYCDANGVAGGYSASNAFGVPLCFRFA